METSVIARSVKTLVLSFILFITSAQASHSAALRMVVQPIMTPAKTAKAYQPLVDYLRQATGQDIELVTARNFFTFWESMKKEDTYDLVLSAAHLSDYLIERMEYQPLARLPDQVSFSLVTGQETLIFSPGELIGQKVATMGSPSMGAVKLAELFPNPLRQPVIIEVPNSQAAVEKLQSGKAVAAIIPSPLVQQYPDLNTVSTTELTPHMCITASPKVPPEVQKTLIQALTQASQTPKGQAMLKILNLPGFEPATTKLYSGYSRLLEGVWGY